MGGDGFRWDSRSAKDVTDIGLSEESDTEFEYNTDAPELSYNED